MMRQPDDPGTDDPGVAMPGEDDAGGFIVVIFVCLMIWAVFITALILFTSPAKAHSFYSAACCSDKDCAPVATGSVKRTGAGWQTPRGGTVPFNDPRVKATPAPFTGVHICERPDGSIICIYVPEAGG